MTQNLVTVLKSVDWSANVSAAYANPDHLAVAEACLHRIAVWSRQLELADEGNAALSFVREMQISAQQCAALVGLSLYKASAASARTMFESCLYYTYFRSHLVELSSLIRVAKFYMSKADIVDYHKLHTADFVTYQDSFGLVGNIDQWYSRVSAVVHGQIPGAWLSHTSLSEISYNEDAQILALDAMKVGETLVHQLLLCTVGNELWTSFSPEAKSYLLKGMPADKRAALGLDLK